MVNERKTEILVRNLLKERGYYNNENIIIEEQSSDNPKIHKLLNRASKSGEGRGYPEFIVSFKNDPQNILVIECKAEIKFHQSKNKKNYEKYAVDGALLYSSYLKDDFNVMAIAVSGETEREMKISHFLWLKGRHIYKDVSDKSFLDPKSLINIVETQSQPLKDEELIKKAIEYNELLHGYSIPEVDRCTLISSILVALQDKAFTNSFDSYHTDEDTQDYNPNEALIDALLSACTTVLKRNKISVDKQEIIIREYEKIKSNHTLRSRTISINRKDLKNTVLRDLISDVMANIMPYINNNIYDVLGKFYTQFIRYAGSDSKTGLVLTPTHVTDLFCDLADITEDDVVFDPCCGTGGFLVSAMNRMLEKSGNNIEKHKNIKSEQLIGIEKRPDMFSHACSNMMMRGDGKSHIHFGDCFSNNLKKLVTNEKPTKTLLNPPYDVGEAGQLEFIENAMECMMQGGICVSICQMSTAISSKKDAVAARERLLEKHTLEAVLSMPDDLFYPVGVVTCILVFKAKTPHPSLKKTFFGYFKDDGFIKVKNKGRIDQNKHWPDIKKRWMNAYLNKESITGLSVMQEVGATDEWCAEAYMETNYTTLDNDKFIATIKDHLVFNFLHGLVNEIASPPIINKKPKLNQKLLQNCVPVKEIFNVLYGVNLELNKLEQVPTANGIPFVSRTANNNGISTYVKPITDLIPNPAHTLSVAGGGSVLATFYQNMPYYSGRDLYVLSPKKHLSALQMLFCCMCLVANKYRYSYGRQANKTLGNIMLPNPDSKIVENYMRTLPYSSNFQNTVSKLGTQ